MHSTPPQRVLSSSIASFDLKRTKMLIMSRTSVVTEDLKKSYLTSVETDLESFFNFCLSDVSNPIFFTNIVE